MNKKQRRIIKKYCWTATGLGVVLGPGVDAAPLAAAWVVGCIHLLDETGKAYNESEIKSAIGTLVAGVGAWFVSGKVAQYIAGLLVAGGLAGAGVSGGLTIFVGLIATLSLNATVNALFTFRFLTACAKVIEDSNASDMIFLKAYANTILDQLISLAEIPSDIAKTARLMFNPVI